MRTIELIPVKEIPEIKPDDNIGEIIIEILDKNNLDLHSKDIVVIAQKIVSKSENRIVDLINIEPSEFSIKVSKKISKDPRLVEVILSETTKIIKMEQRVQDKGRLIVETKGGVISANAGVDASNVPGDSIVTLLPVDADESAKQIRKTIESDTKKNIAVIITDTVGRPWRDGLVDIAIGCSGIEVINDLRGLEDNSGFKLNATAMATADQVATAAGLLMEKLDSIPVVIVRGYDFIPSEVGAKKLIRDPKEDLFR